VAQFCEAVFDDYDGAIDHQADCDSEPTKRHQVRRQANLFMMRKVSRGVKTSYTEGSTRHSGIRSSQSAAKSVNVW
jgi:hypothetical protein